MSERSELSKHLRDKIAEEHALAPEADARRLRVLHGIEHAIAAGVAASSAATGASRNSGGTSFTKNALTLSATFLLGASVGAYVHHALMPAMPAMSAPIQVTAPPPSMVPSIEATPTPVASVAPQASSAGRAPTAPSASQRLGAGDLMEEQDMIDVARAGLARGMPTSTLDAVERHQTKFPRGQFSEERDGLRILALLRLGRTEEARVRATHFRRAYPKSSLLPRIESALPSQ